MISRKGRPATRPSLPRLINLCGVSGARKHMSLYSLRIIPARTFTSRKMLGLVHSANPPRLVHLIWVAIPAIRPFTNLHGKKKRKRKREREREKIELPYPLRLLFSFVTYRPAFIYFLCNEMPRTATRARAARASAAHCATLTKIQAAGLRGRAPEDIPPSEKKKKRGKKREERWKGTGGGRARERERERERERGWEREGARKNKSRYAGV